MLVYPGVKVDTGYAYKKFDEWREIHPEIDSTYFVDNLKGAFLKNNFDEIIKWIHNDFEEVIFREYPILSKIKERLLKFLGAASLTGSGSCIFGILPKDCDESLKREIKNALKDFEVIFARTKVSS